MEIRYGSGTLDFDLELFNVMKILSPPEQAGVKDPIAGFKSALAGPIGSRPLDRLVAERNPRTASIIVEDRTRKNPEYPEMLACLIDLFSPAAGCRLFLVVAYGAHAPHTRQEHEALYGKENLSRVSLVDHDSRNKEKLVNLGRLSTGSEFWINSSVAASDMIISMGNIEPHAFAGFTAGRKLILPGVSGYETIERNHSMVCCDGVGFGLLDGNPIHREMAEAERVAGVDFIINFVRNPQGEILDVFAGSPAGAYQAGTRFCRQVNSVTVDRPCDVAFVSCGGYPKDKSLYQSQRAITSAVNITKEGGTVVVFGEFPEGVGNKLYGEWLSRPVSVLRNLERDQIGLGVHSAYLTGRNLSRCEILLYSSMDDALARQLHLHKKSSVEDILRHLRERHGNDYLSYLIPNGSQVFAAVV